MANLDTFEMTDSGVMIVNGKPLLEVITAIELPYAQKELDERRAVEEDPDELFLLAGEYDYPSLSRRNLLDEPACIAERGFTGVPGSERNKALILECTCGITECWFLTARIDLTSDTVRWHQFSQFHRDWKYDLDYIFDRSDYEDQLQLRGEQGGARQPTTAPDSKSKGNEKPKPESEGRSQ